MDISKRYESSLSWDAIFSRVCEFKYIDKSTCFRALDPLSRWGIPEPEHLTKSYTGQAAFIKFSSLNNAQINVLKQAFAGKTAELFKLDYNRVIMYKPKFICSQRKQSQVTVYVFADEICIVPLGSKASKHRIIALRYLE